MKSKILITLTIICGMILIVYIRNYTFNNKLKSIGKALELDIESCIIEDQKDTHGGFLGDGEYFSKIICKEKQNDEIKSKWKSLPLSEEIQKVMNLISYDGKGGKNVYERYDIPNLENGYYCFVDRHSDSTDKKSDENLNKRSSYNFSLGIYDSENKVLYYYELDT